MCGTQAGEPALAVTCTSCASRWAYSDDGRRELRAARAEISLTLLARVMHCPPRPARDPLPAREPAPAAADAMAAGELTRAGVLRHLAEAARLLGGEWPDPLEFAARHFDAGPP